MAHRALSLAAVGGGFRRASQSRDAATRLRAASLASPSSGVGGRPGEEPRQLHKYGLTAEGKGVGTALRFDSGQTAFTDVPRAMGGKDEAPQPVELMLAALVGCEQATAAYVARHMSPRLRLEGISFQYEAERDPAGATFLPLDAPQPCSPKLLRVRGKAVVALRGGASDGDGARVAELGRLVHQRCPVAQTFLAAGVALETTWEVGLGDGS